MPNKLDIKIKTEIKKIANGN